jgi:hypothetical protein
MSTNGISTPIQNQRRSLPLSGVAIRVIFAFIISSLIVLAFFVSTVISH